jgi:hypothetical protein
MSFSLAILTLLPSLPLPMAKANGGGKKGKGEFL